METGYIKVKKRETFFGPLENYLLEEKSFISGVKRLVKMPDENYLQLSDLIKSPGLTAALIRKIYILI